MQNMKAPLSLGVDLGTSGVKIAIINKEENLIYSSSIDYSFGLEIADQWINCCISIIKNIPKEIKKRIKAISIDGTSGTLLACNYEGEPIGNALPYNLNCIEQASEILKLIPEGGSSASSNSSLARALRLIKLYGTEILLRHQADWVSGWLIEDWSKGEEGNNVRLGWNLISQEWPKNFQKCNWVEALPLIVKSGSIMGKIASKKANLLDLPEEILVIAGTTDSNAAFLAASPSKETGITILGSTLVIKKIVNSPLKGVGITNHQIAGNWVAGGASNSGGAAIRKIFNDSELIELSKQINPEINSGIDLRPLISTGERFPEDDPYMEPILEPRPISDSLYLHGLFEGLAKIELKGWERMNELGATMPKSIITIGGGAKNPQLRKLRERIINIPIKCCNNPPALGVAKIGLKSILKQTNLNA